MQIGKEEIKLFTDDRKSERHHHHGRVSCCLCFSLKITTKDPLLNTQTYLKYLSTETSEDGHIRTQRGEAMWEDRKVATDTVP